MACVIVDPDRKYNPFVTFTQDGLSQFFQGIVGVSLQPTEYHAYETAVNEILSRTLQEGKYNHIVKLLSRLINDSYITHIRFEGPSIATVRNNCRLHLADMYGPPVSSSDASLGEAFETLLYQRLLLDVFGTLEPHHQSIPEEMLTWEFTQED